MTERETVVWSTNAAVDGVLAAELPEGYHANLGRIRGVLVLAMLVDEHGDRRTLVPHWRGRTPGVQLFLCWAVIHHRHLADNTDRWYD